MVHESRALANLIYQKALIMHEKMSHATHYSWSNFFLSLSDKLTILCQILCQALPEAKRD